jgi:hypothetical protein
MSNKSRFRGLRSAKFDWALFDSQPRAVKEICWYATATVHYSKRVAERDAGATAQRFHSADMQELHRKNTEQAYGKDHPQAIRRQAFTMEDLGL